MKVATTNFAISSAKVFPTQILLPPKNGPKLMGCLFFPEGVKYIACEGLNLSGMNSFG